MPQVEIFYNAYLHYHQPVYQQIRRETYGTDIGQTSWLTVDEFRYFIGLLQMDAQKRMLEIASGTGGPAVFIVKETGCHLTGIDINQNGIVNAKGLSQEQGLSHLLRFEKADASAGLPFANDTFDAIISIDSINHFKDRKAVLTEMYRVLKPGGTLLFTDAVVITGILTNEEIALRSSLGFFLFVPNGANEKLLQQVDFKKIQIKDVTENVVLTAGGWYKARQKRKKELMEFETEGLFEGFQNFLAMTCTLAEERRLSRFMYLGIK